MSEEFRASIKLALHRYEAQGYTCRPMTPEEIKAHDESHKEEVVKKPQISFSDRLKQCRRVRRVANKEKIRIVDACEIVGISFSNYRKVISVHKQGHQKHS